MGSLSFVGLGLWDARDITLRGLALAKDADTVFLETYTAMLGGSTVKELEETLGRTVTPADRTLVETGDAILEAGSRGDTVLLVTGDPMAATTHVDLRMRAADLGIPVTIVNNGSIVTAASGLLGLSGYKFGRTTTLVFSDPEHPEYFPTSPYDVIKGNQAQGLHTLVLLDIRAEDSRFMRASEGAAILLEMERRRGEDVLDASTLILAVAQAGSPSPRLVRGPLDAMAAADLGEPLHALVIPGKMSEMESEAVTRFTVTTP